MDLIFKGLLLAGFNAVVFVVAVAWDMMNRYWFPPMKAFINGTASTPAGDNFTAVQHLNNIGALGYQLWVISIVGSLLLFIYFAYKDRENQPQGPSGPYY